jgi:MFS transporter, ACS family, hexuronate transporter
MFDRMNRITGMDVMNNKSRWLICGLLFVATMINYMDRQAIALLKPMLTEQFKWSQIDYANIVFSFQLAYAAGYVLAGRLIDRLGVKIGLFLAVGVWSLACGGHALAFSVMGFCLARGVLGLSQGGHFPGAVKCVAERFPSEERALATGIFNSGSNMGAMVAPFIVPWIALQYGWQTAVIILALLGGVWMIAWGLLYKTQGREQGEERCGEQQATPLAISWLELLRYRPTWAFALANFLVSPFWWFYLFWVPPFLNERYGMDISKMGWPLVVIYSMATVGAIGAGWLSQALMKRKWSVNKARKVALLSCAVCTVPVFMAAQCTSVWMAVAFIALAAAAHQGFSSNLFTLVSDTMPKQTVSSVVGIGGMAGSIGGMLIAKVTGYVLEWTGSYHILFAMAASAYLLAVLVIHLLVPKWTTRES